MRTSLIFLIVAGGLLARDVVVSLASGGWRPLEITSFEWLFPADWISGSEDGSVPLRYRSTLFRWVVELPLFFVSFLIAIAIRAARTWGGSADVKKTDKPTGV